ncbi:hypothetical protein [Suipraeoptans intestinalis]|uniref:hypothetical protein n=1 Tax=Suipraeoptans intestinalis TaxID=2606628 RepID=UPI002FE6F537
MRCRIRKRQPLPSKAVREGLKRRYPSAREEQWNMLEERLLFELSTIESMGYVDYFLIVWDFIKYARDHQIMGDRDEARRREVWCPTVLGSPVLTRSSISCCLSGS